MTKKYNYVLEIMRPAWNGNPMCPKIKVRVHKGTFEENRENLSPNMVDAQQITTFNMTCAKARASEYFSEYRRFLAHTT